MVVPLHEGERYSWCLRGHGPQSSLLTRAASSHSVGVAPQADVLAESGRKRGRSPGAAPPQTRQFQLCGGPPAARISLDRPRQQDEGQTVSVDRCRPSVRSLTPKKLARSCTSPVDFVVRPPSASPHRCQDGTRPRGQLDGHRLWPAWLPHLSSSTQALLIVLRGHEGYSVHHEATGAKLY